jgi:hypothetical protein
MPTSPADVMRRRSLAACVENASGLQLARSVTAISAQAQQSLETDPLRFLSCSLSTTTLDPSRICAIRRYVVNRRDNEDLL